MQRGFQAIVELLQKEFVEPEYRAELGPYVGGRSDHEVCAWLARLTRERLGSELGGLLFAGKSVGTVFGLELKSGERAVLKLFFRSATAEELRAMERCVDALVERGFPAPRPLTRLFELDHGGLGAFYEYRSGELRDGHEPASRRELARTLAELQAVLSTLDPTGLPLAPTRGPNLWPPSHKTFPAGERLGGEWLDELGRRAQVVVLAAAPILALVPAHLDWGVKNVRFEAAIISAVFDWDSLSRASESEMLGRAAAQFTAQWEFPGRVTPTPGEARAFIDEYQAFRGRTFGPDELEVARASAGYLMAQVARLEHGLGGEPGNNYLGLLRELDRESLF